MPVSQFPFPSPPAKANFDSEGCPVQRSTPRRRLKLDIDAPRRRRQRSRKVNPKSNKEIIDDAMKMEALQKRKNKKNQGEEHVDSDEEIMPENSWDQASMGRAAWSPLKTKVHRVLGRFLTVKRCAERLEEIGRSYDMVNMLAAFIEVCSDEEKSELSHLTFDIIMETSVCLVKSMAAKNQKNGLEDAFKMLARGQYSDTVLRRIGKIFASLYARGRFDIEVNGVFEVKTELQRRLVGNFLKGLEMSGVSSEVIGSIVRDKLLIDGNKFHNKHVSDTLIASYGLKVDIDFV